MQRTRTLSSIFSARSTGLLLAGALALGACAGPGEFPPAGIVGGDITVGWDQFRRTHVQWEPTLGVYVVDGDILMASEAAVRRYYDAMVTPQGALLVNRIGTYPNIDDIWSRSQRWSLSFCISNDFGTNKPKVVTALQKAMAAWENAVDVRFVYKPGEDASCDTSNTNVVFNVSRASDTWKYNAGMSFPSEPRSTRQFQIRWNSTDNYGDDLLTAIGLHELGHGLGFRHEHIRDPNVTADCSESSSWRALTPYDSLSVMHYPSCPGWSDPSRTFNFITQWDIEGAQSVYEAPTNVVSASNGTLYARRRSTGDFYQKVSGVWTKIGNPGQAFLAIGNTLYGQRPAGGEPVKYLGPSSGWVIIGGPAGQILNCAGYLCATDPATGNIARYNGSSWTTIGGPGARFQASTSTLFGITPAEHSIARWDGGGWTLVGDGASELFGGGDSIYRYTEDRAWIQRYAGSGSTWTTIGGAGRQFLPSGAALYALSPDAGTVRVYATTQWNPIGGAAARLYGTYGRLYATNPGDESIWRYDANTGVWYGEGKP